eukprot:14041318-Heterocapsa_arctica.AAC.1
MDRSLSVPSARSAQGERGSSSSEDGSPVMKATKSLTAHPSRSVNIMLIMERRAKAARRERRTMSV